MVLAVEVIVCCLIFGIYRVIRIKRDPAYKISNMPEKLQKKVMHMRGYRNRNIRIMTDWEKFVKKLPTLIFWTSACHTDINSRGNKLFNGLCVCTFDMDGSPIVS